MRGLYLVAEPASQRISVDVGIGEPTQKKVSIVLSYVPVWALIESLVGMQYVCSPYDSWR